MNAPSSPAPSSARPTRTVRGTRALAWAVLAASVVEVVAPVITIAGPGTSPGGGSGPDLLITPAGWAFAIWGVIYALAVAQAVAVLVRGADSVPRRLQVDQLVLYLGGAAWILMAALDSSLLTAAALLVMLLAALDGLLTVTRSPLAAGRLSTLTRAGIGLYAGWVTAAFFLNVSTALVDAGALDARDLPWQLVMLVLATVTLLALVVASRGVPAYTVAGAWALVGIAAAAASDGTTEVTVAAVVAAVLLVAATLGVRLGGLPRGGRTASAA